MEVKNQMFLSVIIPVYNPNIERFDEMLKSINNQTSREFDVLFVNDAGNDEFKKEIESILVDNLKYQIIDLPENVGQGLARQRGIEESESEWITFLDQDDVLAESAIESAKQIIEETNCVFMLSTRSIIANNPEFMINKEYIVEDSPSVLHGKFYKKDVLSKYNIHFTDKVRAHEDTFFQNLAYSYAALSPEFSQNDRAIVCTDAITYFWYLWKDSQSHNYVYYGPFGRISYLENNMDQYVTATIESYKQVTAEYGNPEDFMYSKLTSFLYFTYWFEQSFIYLNPIGWKKDNLKIVKIARDFCMKEFNMHSVSELTNMLLDIPSMYEFTFKEVKSNITDIFIPRQTVEQFYLELDSKIEELCS